jgi:hypothetical protein
VKHVVEMAAGDMIYTPGFMTTSSGIQVILMLLAQQYEMLQCWSYSLEVFIKYCVVEMVSGGVIYVHTKFHKDRFRRSEVVRWGTRIDTHQRDLISVLFLIIVKVV